jgi:hypothetical protein
VLYSQATFLLCRYNQRTLGSLDSHFSPTVSYQHYTAFHCEAILLAKTNNPIIVMTFYY